MRPEGTLELPLSFQDINFSPSPQPLRSWLISNVAPRQRIFTADFSFARLRFSRIIEAATISDFHGQTRRHQQVARQLRA
jgi:hypothetical protein